MNYIGGYKMGWFDLILGKEEITEQDKEEKADTKVDVWDEVTKNYKWCPESDTEKFVKSLKDLVKGKE
jgi:hypothetical protein